MVFLKTERLHSTSKFTCQALTELAHRRGYQNYFSHIFENNVVVTYAVNQECVTHFSHIFENNVVVTIVVKHGRDTFLSIVQPTICVDKATPLDATFTMEELLELRKGFGKAMCLVGMVLL